MKWLTTLLIPLLLVGCLQPGPNIDKTNPQPPTPPTPPVVRPALAETIHKARTEQLKDYAGLARTLAGKAVEDNLTPELQGEAWTKGVVAIDKKANDIMAPAIRDALKAAKNPTEVSANWEAVAKGYDP